MPHSFAQSAQLACDQCGAAIEGDIRLLVDGAERPDLLARMRAGDLHDLTCGNCGQVIVPDAPVLVYLPASLLPQGADEQPLLVFSPAQRTSAEEDEQQGSELLGKLAASLGETWQEEWGKNVPGVPRAALPEILSADPQAALAESRRQWQEAALDRQPPLVRAVLAFVQAPDEEAARQVFTQQSALLQPYEAQRLLDEQVRSDDPATEAHLVARRELLRTLRGAGAGKRPTADGQPSNV